MKTNAKIALVAAGAVVAAVALSEPRLVERRWYRLEPDGEYLTGEAGKGEIPLARVKLEDGLPTRKFMGPLARPGSLERIQVRSWWVTLEDGRRVKLEFRGAMPMLPGETKDEARARFEAGGGGDG